MIRWPLPWNLNWLIFFLNMARSTETWLNRNKIHLLLLPYMVHQLVSYRKHVRKRETQRLVDLERYCKKKWSCKVTWRWLYKALTIVKRKTSTVEFVKSNFFLNPLTPMHYVNIISVWLYNCYKKWIYFKVFNQFLSDLAITVGSTEFISFKTAHP